MAIVYQGSPAKLRDDEGWGVRIQGEQVGSIDTGDVIEADVTTQAGKKFERTVEIFWVDHEEQVALGREVKTGEQRQTKPATKSKAGGNGADVYIHAGQVQVGKKCPACHQMVAGYPKEEGENFAGMEPF